MNERDSLFEAVRQKLAPHLVTRIQGRGIWRGRGTAKVVWRDSVNEVSPIYVRIRRRNPIDHKVLRLRRLEVWW